MRIHPVKELGDPVDAFRDLLPILREIELRGIPLAVPLSRADKSAFDEFVHPDELGPLVTLVETHELRLGESGIVTDGQQDVQ